jgi:hypothetical protein
MPQTWHFSISSLTSPFFPVVAMALRGHIEEHIVQELQLVSLIWTLSLLFSHFKIESDGSSFLSLLTTMPSVIASGNFFRDFDDLFFLNDQIWSVSIIFAGYLRNSHS